MAFHLFAPVNEQKGEDLLGDRLTFAHAKQEFKKSKKRKGIFLSVIYARFLSIITIRTPTIAMTIIMAIADATIYVIKSPVVARFA